MTLQTKITAHFLKDMFHAIFPTIFLLFISHSWLMVALNMVSILLKTYVYTYLRNVEEISQAAIFGILFQAILITGYIEVL